jgi:hypothetical protein
MERASVRLSWHLGHGGIRSREAIVICESSPRCGSRSRRLRFHKVSGLRSSTQTIGLATLYPACRHGRGRVSQVVYAGEDLEDRIQDDPLRQQAKTTPSTPPKGVDPNGVSHNYMGRETFALWIMHANMDTHKQLLCSSWCAMSSTLNTVAHRVLLMTCSLHPSLKPRHAQVFLSLGTLRQAKAVEQRDLHQDYPPV